MSNAPDQARPAVDTSSHDEFFRYYAEASLSEATTERYLGIQKTLLRFLGGSERHGALEVADIGCGAGTQSILWAEKGHRVHALDVNERLLELARQRATERGLGITFELGTAEALPWSSNSMDVCIMPELLEHVTDWRACLAESARVVRVGGVLFVTTTNRLCPKQQEFNLPLYSWYPRRLKRRYERLAKSTRPEIANFATYPAIHWFSFYSLQSVLEEWGFRCLDRFQTADPGTGSTRRFVLSLFRTSSALRFLGQIASPSTQVVAVKTASPVSATP